MVRAAVLTAIVIVGVLGAYIYRQLEQSPTDSTSGGGQITKCVTEDGETIYGNVSTNENCRNSEVVEPATVNTMNMSGRVASDSSTFKCDGREYCSQMTSCAEARFFQNNCPNTKMDGDNDGIPCESQWCN